MRCCYRFKTSRIPRFLFCAVAARVDLQVLITRLMRNLRQPIVAFLAETFVYSLQEKRMSILNFHKAKVTKQEEETMVDIQLPRLKHLSPIRNPDIRIEKWITYFLKHSSLTCLLLPHFSSACFGFFSRVFLFLPKTFWFFSLCKL